MDQLAIGEPVDPRRCGRHLLGLRAPAGDAGGGPLLARGRATLRAQLTENEAIA